jgi:hypothetical protein
MIAFDLTTEASAAERVDLHLGSRAVELVREIVRLPYEKEVWSLDLGKRHDAALSITQS